MLKKLHVNSENPESVSLWFLFWNFFKIGSTAFGGFMALISVVENRMVRRHKLLTHEDMLDGISLATVLPGPVAANVVAYVGYRLRRTNGAVVSAIGVLLPSFILVIGLTIAYLQVGEIPALQKAFAGFIPAVAAIILSAARRMSKKAIKGWRELVIALIAAVLLKVIGGFYITVLVVVGSGLVGWLWLGDTKQSGQENSQAQPIQESIQGISWLKLSVTLLILLSFLLLSLIPLPFLGETSLAKLFVTFSGMSLMLFGGGYVFIPLIQEVVVNNYGWVTQTEFANAIAIGQITPGPILISAAFIGYVVKGISGAIVATVGIFLPPGLLMVTCSHLLKHIKESTVIQAALKGIRPAVIGMIITAAIVVAGSAEFHVGSLVIFAAALAAMWRFRVKVLLIIPIAGILGLVLYSI
ncbi:MAG: chromate efflux transporter [Moorea sp. SIO1F2]|uniref:chromate efflux transporter n=1 Tax=Moorena sp. SIO1F2 TaxID=2607819 RepID=UPI0013B7FDFA|nr:chromate efflux transporter [Moorena sp. SIO1F2]NET84567.1 chromate efflux transporter [Moorena sp. SIO1F2]